MVISKNPAAPLLRPLRQGTLYLSKGQLAQSERRMTDRAPIEPSWQRLRTIALHPAHMSALATTRRVYPCRGNILRG
jgi:hypothetical protein